MVDWFNGSIFVEMENKKASETLEDGFAGSKLVQNENPRGKIIQEAESNIRLFNLFEKSQIDVNSNAALAGELYNGNVEESLMPDAVTGNNQMNNSSLDIYSEDNVYIHCNKPRNDYVVPVLQEDLNLCGNAEVWDQRVEESVNKGSENGNDLFHCQEPVSPGKLEISGNGIDIFVEVFGPLDGLYDSDNNVNDSIEHSEREISPDQENENLSHDVESVAVQKEEKGGSFGGEEFLFDVGDLVWVRTRTQLWWPGVISDYHNDTEDSTEIVKKCSFLVKYIGNGHEIWSSIPNMKPFAEYFEEMSEQNESRSFRGSLEKALCEIGWRVKSKMTCPCFSDKSRNFAAGIKECESLARNRVNESVLFSLSRFEPVSFVTCIRKLACSVSVPGKIDLIFLRNRLSAFYRSTGHCQLPLQLLRPNSEAAQDGPDRSTTKALYKGRNGNLTICRRKKRKNSEDAVQIAVGKMTSSGKGSKSWERKKSKYLSFPFTNANPGPTVPSTSGQETEDPKFVSGRPSKSSPGSNNKGTNSQKKRLRKLVKGRHMINKADDINACSAELLAELRSSAVDCFYPRRSKYSDSLTRFYWSFRIFSFLNGETADNPAGLEQASSDEKCHVKDSLEAELLKGSLGTSKVSEDQVKENVNSAASTKNQDEQGHVIRKRRPRKKKEEVIPTVVAPTINSFGVASHVKSCVISFQPSCSQTLENHTIPGLLQVDTVTKPDPKVNNLNFSFEQIPVRGPVLTPHRVEPLPEKSTEGFFPPRINSAEQMKSFMYSPLQKEFHGVLHNYPQPNNVEPMQLFAHCPLQKDSQVALHNAQQPNNVELMKAYAYGPPLPKDMQAALQNAPNLNNGVRDKYTTQLWTAELAPGESNSNVVNTGPSSSFLQTGLLSFGSQPQRKKRMRKTCDAAPVIPDLNGNTSGISSAGPILPEGSHVSPEGQPQIKRRRRIRSADGELGPDGKINGVVNNKEDAGGSLLLSFAPESPLPSKETLVAIFSRFGLLKESEIQILDCSTAKIVYERSSDAGFAFRSLEKSNPFGASLASFKLVGVPASMIVKKKNKLISFSPFAPPHAFQPPVKPAEAPDLAILRKKMEMMKNMLDKAGDSLSLEMRAKLENEIKGFLDKISSMTNSSHPPTSGFQQP